MAGMGPAPKPGAQRRRTNATIAMTKLPAGGRKGPAPTWPMPGDPEPYEELLWGELWATPQAVAWERNGWTRVVARYCKVVAHAEVIPHPAMLAEARQLEDRLGLTPMAMLRLRWEVTEDELGAARTASEPAASRPRLLAIDPNAAASEG